MSRAPLSLLMQTTNPGSTTTVTFSGIPADAVVGFQVLRAASGLVSIARTELGVTQRPPGTGNFVAIFNAPIEGDLYLVVADWSAGVLTPETSQVKELKVETVAQPGSSGLGTVADYVKMRLGGETFKGLAESDDYGMAYISQAIELVKRRVMSNPPAVGDEGSLDILVQDYLGLLGALELIPAARDWWASQVVSTSTGDDPTEIVTFTDRSKMVDTLRDDLLRRLAAAQALAIPLLDAPRLPSGDEGPAIDEDDDFKVTSDPRDFASLADYPEPVVGEVIPGGWKRTWERIG